MLSSRFEGFIEATLFNKSIRQFVWALGRGDARITKYRDQATRQELLCLLEPVLFTSHLGGKRTIKLYFKLKSLIMAQIERWRQA